MLTWTILVLNIWTSYPYTGGIKCGTILLHYIHTHSNIHTNQTACGYKNEIFKTNYKVQGIKG